VTKNTAEICSDFGCSPLEGVLSHELTKYFIDNDFMVLNRQEKGVEEVEV